MHKTGKPFSIPFATPGISVLDSFWAFFYHDLAPLTLACCGLAGVCVLRKNRCARLHTSYLAHHASQTALKFPTRAAPNSSARGAEYL